VAWVDGGARGNPGQAGCGVILELADGRREQHTVFIGPATNNVAEYVGLIAAMQRLRALGATTVEVRSDSQLLVRQLTGEYRVKAPHLQRLWLVASRLARSFARVSFVHVPRRDNAAADRLVNLAIDTGKSTLPVPEGLP
jgi:ribonuclease HI